ncbi:nuclear transport factor 2 family protein [Pedobacter cryoconitis]|uniref:nuclear transport factor 2 family protein n=1 Tax=Pedobacter cryoconitis TaxID=188932 RepID=UPI001617DB71|nr:PhzA/PhzB family protein [Pedobacter cryoconitis]MBB5647643.1 hypothetical protein [Pedobacter cryoconitis]
MEKNQGNILLKKLLLSFSESAEDVVKLFNEDAVIEFPYAASAGFPDRRKINLNTYFKHINAGLKNMLNLNFSDIRVYPMEKKDEYWAEAHGEAVITSTGLSYAQDYVMYFKVSNNKFQHYKEYWDPVPGLKSFGGTHGSQDIFESDS